MNQSLEIAARAHYEAFHNNNPSTSWDDLDAQTQRYHRNIVQAAIKACTPADQCLHCEVSSLIHMREVAGIPVDATTIGLLLQVVAEVIMSAPLEDQHTILHESIGHLHHLVMDDPPAKSH
jgi:hypothetical protein